MFRTTRAPAAFAALLGLVLGLLACGAFARTEPAGAPHAEDAVTVAVVSAPGAPVPGCDPGRSAGGTDEPLVPPRAHGFAELLPALAADRVPCGVRPVDAAAGARPMPGREPPTRVPPSPVELSVLRV
ncbi:hypothetical protein [Streptomyces sp. NPDC001744]|uniref:hypothetical protein n=1 Tax=Streptomyces sp. NPDC001744 TaxID=3364606 RepID=UPI0036C3607F